MNLYDFPQTAGPLAPRDRNARPLTVFSSHQGAAAHVSEYLPFGAKS